MRYDILEPGFTYHIFNKGINRENIFKEPKNYDYFLRLVEKYFSNNILIYAYCLLPNHFHFLVKIQPTVINSSQIFSNFFNAYSKSVNKMYNREGSLFKDRFARKRVTNEAYLRNLILYIHTNPVHHGFDISFEEYPYSSYVDYINMNRHLVDFKNIKYLFDDIENFQLCHNLKQNLQLNTELKSHYLEI